MCSTFCGTTNASWWRWGSTTPAAGSMHAPLAVPDPGFRVFAHLVQPLDAFKATRNGKAAPFGRRNSTGEFEFKAAQKVGFWPLFRVRFAFFALKNQFVLHTSKKISHLFATDS